ncbi:hypothetical protein SteCoe_6814 [Stentor coeruleus]|uniref:Uncharacterized protein n=1 Tax=Stentor coeruleus TaxID=5963 RepID=A0A1R2CP06_9CILI|nr:hypothetical protein SteCoe_6814 [Stentor coeruleus]
MYKKDFELEEQMGNFSRIREDISITGSSDTGSLFDLPLPSMTNDEEISSRSNMISTDNAETIEEEFPIKNRARYFYHSPDSFPLRISYKAQPNFQVSISDIFKKQREGGINLVKEVRKKPSNSYLARKERFIKAIQSKGHFQNSQTIPFLPGRRYTSVNSSFKAAKPF